ncbi:hypothetical protein EJB05_04948, partial [Eragrostis curvula]
MLAAFRLRLAIGVCSQARARKRKKAPKGKGWRAECPRRNSCITCSGLHGFTHKPGLLCETNLMTRDTVLSLAMTEST